MIKFKMVLSDSVTIAELGGTEYWINWDSGTTIIMHPGWTGLRATFGRAFNGD